MNLGTACQVCSMSCLSRLHSRSCARLQRLTISITSFLFFEHAHPTHPPSTQAIHVRYICDTLAMPPSKSKEVNPREQTQRADTLLRFLEHNVDKYQTRTRIFFYGFFIVCLWLAGWFEGNPTGSGTEDFYQFIAAKARLNEEDFHKTVSDHDKLWKWMSDTIPPLMVESKDPNQLRSLVLIRQYRATFNKENCNKCDECKKLNMVPEHIVNRFRTTCTTLYDDDSLETADFTAYNTQPFKLNAPPWTTNAYRDAKEDHKAGRSRQARSLVMHGEIATYSAIDKSYSVYYLFDSTKKDVEDNLADLQRASWIDVNTRALIVEVMTYNPSQDRYLLTSFLTEIATSGAFVNTIFGERFSIFTLDNARGIGILVSHILSFVLILIDAGLSVFYVIKNRALTQGQHWTRRCLAPFTFFRLLQMVAFGLYMNAAYYRMRLWMAGSEAGSVVSKDLIDEFEVNRAREAAEQLALWEWLAQYAADFGKARDFLALTSLFSWLRIFEFMQHFSRLSVLTQTISSSLRDCVAISIIFCIIIFGFSISFTMLWGGLSQYRTIPQAATTLMIIAQTGGTVQYKQQEEQHPLSAPAFVITYLALTTFIIVNMVISVITIGFKMVQDAMPRGESWSVSAFVHDIKKFCSQRRDECCPYDDSEDETDVEGGGPTTKEKGTLDMRTLYRIHEVLSHKVQREGASGSMSLTNKEVAALILNAGIHIKPHLIGKIFSKSAGEIRATSTAIKVSSEGSADISDTMALIEVFVKKLSHIDDNTKRVANLQATLDTSRALVKTVATIQEGFLSRLATQQQATTEMIDLFERADALVDETNALCDLCRALTTGCIEAGGILKNSAQQSHQAEAIAKEAQDKMARLIRLIRSTLEGAVPTTMLREDAPLLVKKAQGKSFISSVEHYDFTNQDAERTYEEPARVAPPIDAQRLSEFIKLADTGGTAKADRKRSEKKKKKKKKGERV